MSVFRIATLAQCQTKWKIFQLQINNALRLPRFLKRFLDNLEVLIPSNNATGKLNHVTNKGKMFFVSPEYIHTVLYK